jgi:RNA polymerase sigma-70 factor (ECF subfamily)
MNMEESEIRLVRGARDGDRDAFAALVARHWNRSVRLARSVVGDADSEDAVQEGFLVAWRKMGSLRHPEAFSGWLTRILYRICLQKTKTSRPVSIDELDEPQSNPGNLESDIDVERILRRLAPQQRAVMHLTIVEGMTDREISDALRIRPASVRAHRRRARESLSRVLRGEKAKWTKT